MSNPVEEFLESDHRRLEALLARVDAESERTDAEAYRLFREGLLRHISMEERVLMPAIRTMRLAEGREDPFVHERQIRLDHGAIGTLLVLPPGPFALRALRMILAAHNLLEEGAHGLYREVSRMDAAGMQRVLDQLHAIPSVPLSTYMDNPAALSPACRAMQRAGYDPDPLDPRV